MLEHKHLLLRGKILNPPKNIEEFSEWIQLLVTKIDMKILMGPFTVYSDMIGNRGITSITVIETSHISAHVWDESDPALIELDVFSCKDFDPSVVVDHMKEFGLTHINFRMFDRTKSLKEEKLYTLYKTTNNINNKFYIGVHNAFVADDDYLGSGVALKKAIIKYGRENFSKEIIQVFSDRNQAYNMEKLIVDYEFVQRKDTYNLNIGGTGFEEKDKEKIISKISAKAKNRKKRMWITNELENILMDENNALIFLAQNPSWKQGRILTNDHIKNLSGVKRKTPSPLKGKSMSDDQKEKISQTMISNISNGYQVHNKGKKLYIIDDKKVWR